MNIKPIDLIPDPADGIAADVKFGPAEHNAWSVSDGAVSLVRQPRLPRTLRFASSLLDLEIDLGRSAIIVVDMQNDFCHKEGWFAQKGVSLRATRRPIPVLKKLLPCWREAGGQVVWLNWGIRADRANLSPTIHFKGKRTATGIGYAERSPIDRGLSVVTGEWGAQVIDELKVEAADLSVDKHRVSGFWDNELDAVLRLRGITTLLFVGINTDRCVFSTLQDAAFLGYDCILLKDACSTPSPAYVTRSILFIVEQLHGFVATAQSLLTALGSPR
ncbi:isochorismatase family cysteine hydrolase [Pseudomonas sp. dw_358]|uniref:cysteine hydrolase family protein n=1 Tax=Pseudomonas sp. dw_358 TaxID=2720083 RepID=UPI001BD5EBCE|nr:isochorismatase family cysteine hydrolase [Pseudomonas sp. dw_358]